MEEERRKEIDEWWRFKTRVENFNKIRKHHIFTSHILVFNESMSVFLPRLILLLLCILFKITVILTLLFLCLLSRTTTTGDLTNLSFLNRKLEPLGTEY